MKFLMYECTERTKTMKRTMATAALLLTMLPVVTSCGGSDTASVPTPEDTSDTASVPTPEDTAVALLEATGVEWSYKNQHEFIDRVPSSVKSFVLTPKNVSSDESDFWDQPSDESAFVSCGFTTDTNPWCWWVSVDSTPEGQKISRKIDQEWHEKVTKNGGSIAEKGDVTYLEDPGTDDYVSTSSVVTCVSDAVCIEADRAGTNLTQKLPPGWKRVVEAMHTLTHPNG